MSVGSDDFSKIENRLKRCRLLLEQLRTCDDTDEAEVLWENFVASWCQSQKLLGKFCKMVGLNGVADGIKAALDGERASVRYLFHARNAEEHSFQAVTREVPTQKAVRVPGPFGGVFAEGAAIAVRNSAIVVGGQLIPQPDYTISPQNFGDLSGLPQGSSLTTLQSYIVPVALKDRGVEYLPPDFEVAPQEWAATIAQDAVDWLDEMVSEAVDELGWVR